MNKDEISDALEDERENFLEAIDGLSAEQLQTSGVVGEWSVKDIMIHLSAWEAELVKLLWQARQGQKPTTLHFSQIDTDAINQQWFENYRSRSLERVIDDFEAVRKQTIRRLEAFSDDDLNQAQLFTWQGKQPLWEWIANDSFQHENEHAAQIREWRARL
jgi:hypothetical protein